MTTCSVCVRARVCQKMNDVCLIAYDVDFPRGDPIYTVDNVLAFNRSVH